jgi:hypothetical protein
VSGGRPNKRTLEAARRDRAARKRERKEARADEAAVTSVSSPVERSEAEVIAALDALHRARDAGELGLEEFESTRAELLAALAR